MPDVSEALQATLPVQQVEIRPGRTIAVHVGGAASAETVMIFAHGSAASMLQWSDQAAYFAECGHRVVLYDWLG